MSITPDLIKELRERTGSGIMDCKGALNQTNGDINLAIEFLRKKGLSDASKKRDRIAKEGLIYSYIHHSGKVGVLLEINCETDFVARCEKFQSLTKDIAMHIAAASPNYINKKDVPSDVTEKEREIYTAQMKESGKPQNIIDRIVDGKMDKYYSETCLLDQTFVKDNSKTILDIVTSGMSEMGENITIRRFVRYQLGEK